MASLLLPVKKTALRAGLCKRSDGAGREARVFAAADRPPQDLAGIDRGGDHGHWRDLTEDLKSRSI
jgi:hypothetical protein